MKKENKNTGHKEGMRLVELSLKTCPFCDKSPTFTDKLLSNYNDGGLGPRQQCFKIACVNPQCLVKPVVSYIGPGENEPDKKTDWCEATNLDAILNVATAWNYRKSDVKKNAQKSLTTN